MLEADWIAKVLALPLLDKSGHGTDPKTGDLGLGWLYYAMGRILRPMNVVVIGSWRGFVPIMFGKALADNGDGSRVTFVDPSLADAFWEDAGTVLRHFQGFGLSNIDHYLKVTSEFVKGSKYQRLQKEGIGLLFVDGYHTEKHAQYDHEAFKDFLNGPCMFHDSLSSQISNVYGKGHEYQHSVSRYLEKYRQGKTNLLDFKAGNGLTILQDGNP